MIKIYVYKKSDGQLISEYSGSTEGVLADIPTDCDFTLAPVPDFDQTWRWLDDKWVADVAEETPLEVLQERVWTDIKNERLKQITSGVLVKSINKKFHTDETSAIQYSNVAGMIALDNYEPKQWKVMDNSWVLLTKELFIELQKAININTQVNYEIAEQHKESMMLLDNPSSYDYSTGWTNGVVEYT